MLLTTTFPGLKAPHVALCHHPQVQPPLTHGIPSGTQSLHDLQLATTPHHPSTPSLLPGLEELTSSEHQAPSPSFKQLQLNFLLTLFFRNKDCALLLECSFPIPSRATPLVLLVPGHLSVSSRKPSLTPALSSPPCETPCSWYMF